MCSSEIFKRPGELPAAGLASHPSAFSQAKTVPSYSFWQPQGYLTSLYLLFDFIYFSSVLELKSGLTQKLEEVEKKVVALRILGAKI